jgi:MFS family permease
MDQSEDNPSLPKDARTSLREALVRQMPAGFGAHALFGAVTMLYWASMYVYIPVLSPYLEFRGLPMGLIGFVLGSYGLTQLIIRLPLGLWSDRLNRRKPFILLGMLAGVISCWLMIAGGSWEWQLAGRITAGVSASTWVAFTVLYASYFPPQDSTKAMADASFLTNTGRLLSMVAAGWLLEAGGYDAVFLTGSGLAVIGLAAALFLREPRAGRAEPSSGAANPEDRAPGRERLSWKQLLTSSKLIWASTLCVLVQGVMFITMFGFTPLMAERMGASGTQLTWLTCAIMIPNAFAAFAAGRWLEPKYGARKLIAIAFLGSAVFTAIIPFCPNLYWLYATQALNGAAQGVFTPVLMGLAIRDFPARQRATAMGFYQAFFSLGMFSGPFIAGWLNEWGGLAAGFLFGAALGLTGCLLASVWDGRLPRFVRAAGADRNHRIGV